LFLNAGTNRIPPCLLPWTACVEHAISRQGTLHRTQRHPDMVSFQMLVYDFCTPVCSFPCCHYRCCGFWTDCTR
jgi:hypothetical protein